MKKHRKVNKPKSGRDAQRYTEEYQKVRRRVLRRDNYKCQYPGCKRKTKSYLQVHHIIKFSKSKSLRENERNMITLCRDHHSEVTKKEKFYIDLFNMILKRKYNDYID